MTEQATDWAADRIRAAIRDKGISQAALSRRAGLAESAVRNAMVSPHNPRAERAVADLLGVAAQDIWPSRYFPDGRRKAAPRSSREPSAVARAPHRQKEAHA